MKYAEAKHLIVDIETLGIKPPVPVLTIGAVVYDTKQSQALAKGFEIDLKSYECGPAKTDLDTVLFWMKESKEAQKAAFLGENVRPLKYVLLDFVDLCNTVKPDFYWGCSHDFDFGHLEWWLNYFCIPVPWKFWQLRDIRTLCCDDLIPEKKRDLFKDVFPSHSAVSDAMRECELLKLAINKLKGE